jgi:hypothetical protein
VGDADARLHHVARIAGVVLGVAFAGIGYPLSIMLQVPGVLVLPFCLVFGVGVGLFVHRVSLGIAEGSGRAFGAFIQPSGNSSPYQRTYSAEDALAARGDIVGALRAYEAIVAADPSDVMARRKGADLHARHGDPRRAAELFAEIRRIPAVPRSDQLYASQRLIDLLLGSLGDKGRALVELRRLVETFPGTREAAGARIAIDRMKREDERDAAERS